MPAPYFIVGPTAAGKTGIAIRAAELAGAEILNADAFQVYAGLEHLTAKPSSQELARVRHHLVGHVPRSESYHVARYHAEAAACLDDASRRGKSLIVVGGSGLYVKSLTHGLSPLPPAQPDIRTELERLDLPVLAARLEALDPVAARTVDLLNKRRLVRAVEVCLITGGRFSDLQIAWKRLHPPIHGVFLVREKTDLHERINCRAATLLEDESLEEVRRASSSPLSDTSSQIIGLTEITALLAGQMTRAACLERIQTSTRKYAKRQLTWFRGESFEEIIDLTTETNPEECARWLAEKVRGAS